MMDTLQNEWSFHTILQIRKKVYGIYPNPLTNILRISAYKTTTVVKVVISDQNGRPVLIKKNISHYEVIDLSAILPGIYIIQI